MFEPILGHADGKTASSLTVNLPGHSFSYFTRSELSDSAPASTIPAGNVFQYDISDAVAANITSSYVFSSGNFVTHDRQYIGDAGHTWDAGLSFFSPTTSGLPQFVYSNIGLFYFLPDRPQGAVNSWEFFVYGNPTPNASLPSSGQKTFNNGFAIAAEGPSSTEFGQGVASLTVDFGTGAVSVSISFPAKDASHQWNYATPVTLSGTGTFVSEAYLQFTGTMSGGTGTFAGRFYGPAADEFGCAFEMSDTPMQYVGIAGVAVGKQ